MAEVNIIRHRPGAVFCNPCEVITVDDDGKVVRRRQRGRVLHAEHAPLHL